MARLWSTVLLLVVAYSDGVASLVCRDGEHLVVSEGQPDRCCGYCGADSFITKNCTIDDGLHCKVCNKCEGDHQVMLRNCSYFSNALCGCQDGYEMHNDTGKCQKKNGDHQVIYEKCSNSSKALCGCQDGHKMRNNTVQCQKKNMFHGGNIVPVLAAFVTMALCVVCVALLVRCRRCRCVSGSEKVAGLVEL